MNSLEHLGFGLYPVETRDGSNIAQLVTGFKLFDEFPFDIYIEEVGNQIHVWDEGLTYPNLLAISPDLVKASRINVIDDVVGMYGVAFEECGSFEIYGAKDKASDVVCDYLSAMINLDRWVVEIFARKPSKNNLVESAKVMFKRWRPSAVIKSNPTIDGLDGSQLEFDFSVDSDYIDVLSATSNSTANFLRKATNFRLANIPGRPLAVVDDSKSSKQAHFEISLISAHFNAIRLSRLSQNAESHAN